MQFYSGKWTDYMLNNETLDKFYGIISNRYKENYIQIMSEYLSCKIHELQVELNIKVDRQNDELKQMMKAPQRWIQLSKVNEI